jgi:hypothetical protein
MKEQTKSRDVMAEVHSLTAPSLSTEQILGQLDAEVQARVAEASSHGWTASNVLLALVSVVGLLITQFAAHWEGPAGVLYRWTALFLLFSLFFDTLITYSPMPYRRFFPDDIRGRLQWTDLTPQHIVAFDLLRYLFLLTLVTYFRFPIEWYVQLLVGLFYGTLLCLGLLIFQFNTTPILIPLEKLQQYKQKGSLLLCATGFISGWLFLRVILDNADHFRSTDLFVGGAFVSTCYLLRRLGPRAGGLIIIEALRQIRRGLALGDVDGHTAKRRYAAVTSGMTLAEAVDDYTQPVRLLLLKALEEVSTARDILDSLRESIDNKVTAPTSSACEPDFNEQWTAQREHYGGAQRLITALSQVGQARRFRLLNWLMRYYRGRYFPVLSGQSRIEIQVVLARIEGLYQDYQRTEREYLEERERAASAMAERLDTSRKETDVAPASPGSFDLPSWLQMLRTSLLTAR